MSCSKHPQSMPWESSTGVRCAVCGEPWPRGESTHVALLGQRIFDARCSTSVMTPDDAIVAAKVTLEDYYSLGDHYQQEVNELRAAEITAAVSAEREQWKARVRALVDAMPRCTCVDKIGNETTTCTEVATRAYERGGPRYCDAHGTNDRRTCMLRGDGSLADVPEYPRAPALRALLAMLEES